MEEGSPERQAFKRRLGRNLAVLRDALGIDFTQEKVAERLGIDVETLGRWERGTREPKAYDVARLAESYGLPADWLLSPTDSITELEMRALQLRQAALEAARRDVESETARRAVAAASAPRGKRPPRKPTQ